MLGLGERDSAFLARFAVSVPFRFRLLVVCQRGGFDRRRERSFVRSFRELHRRCQSGTKPILDIASAIVGAFEVERFAAQQSD